MSSLFPERLGANSLRVPGYKKYKTSVMLPFDCTSLTPPMSDQPSLQEVVLQDNLWYVCQSFFMNEELIIWSEGWLRTMLAFQ